MAWYDFLLDPVKQYGEALVSPFQQGAQAFYDALDQQESVAPEPDLSSYAGPTGELPPGSFDTEFDYSSYFGGTQPPDPVGPLAPEPTEEYQQEPEVNFDFPEYTEDQFLQDFNVDQEQAPVTEQPEDFYGMDQNYDPYAYEPDQPYFSFQSEPVPAYDFTPWSEPPEPEYQPGATPKAIDFISSKEAASPEEQTKELLNKYLTLTPSERRSEWGVYTKSEDFRKTYPNINPDLILYDDQGNPTDYLDFEEPTKGKAFSEVIAERDAAKATFDAAQARYQALLDEGDDDPVKLANANAAIAEAQARLTSAEVEADRWGNDAVPPRTTDEIAQDIQSTREAMQAKESRAAWLSASPGAVDADALQRQYQSAARQRDAAELAMEQAQQRMGTARTQSQYDVAARMYQTAELARRQSSQRIRDLMASAGDVVAKGETDDLITADNLRKSAAKDKERLDSLMQEYRAASRLDETNSFLQSAKWLKDAVTAKNENTRITKQLEDDLLASITPGLAGELAPANAAPFGRTIIKVPVTTPTWTGKVETTIREESVEMPWTLDPRNPDVVRKDTLQQFMAWVDRLGKPYPAWSQQERQMVIESVRQAKMSDKAVQSKWDALHAEAVAGISRSVVAKYDEDLAYVSGVLTGTVTAPIKVTEDFTAMLIRSATNISNAIEMRSAQAEGREPQLHNYSNVTADLGFVKGATNAIKRATIQDPAALQAALQQSQQAQESERQGEKFGAMLDSLLLSPVAAEYMLSAAGLTEGALAAKGIVGASRYVSDARNAANVASFVGLTAASSGSIEETVDTLKNTLPFAGLGVLGELGSTLTRTERLQTAAQTASRLAGRAGQRISSTAGEFARSEGGDWGRSARAFLESETAAVDIKALHTKISDSLKHATSNVIKDTEAKKLLGEAKEPWEMTGKEFYDSYWFHGTTAKIEGPLRAGTYYGDFGTAQMYSRDITGVITGGEATSGRVLAVPKASVVDLGAEPGNALEAAHRASGKPIARAKEAYGFIEATGGHKAVIERAINEGNAVPREVLAEYPSLLKQYQGKNLENTKNLLAGVHRDLLDDIAGRYGVQISGSKGARESAEIIDELATKLDAQGVRDTVLAWNKTAISRGVQGGRAAIRDISPEEAAWFKGLSTKEQEAVLAVRNAAADMTASSESGVLAGYFDTLIDKVGKTTEAVNNRARGVNGNILPTARMLTNGVRKVNNLWRTFMGETIQGSLRKAVVDTGVGADSVVGARIQAAIEERIPMAQLSAKEQTAVKLLQDLATDVNQRMQASGAKVRDFDAAGNEIWRDSLIDPKRFTPMVPKPEVIDAVRMGGKKEEAMIQLMMDTAVNPRTGEKLFVGHEGRQKVLEIFNEWRQAQTGASWAMSRGGLYARRFGMLPDSMRDSNLVRVYSNYLEHTGREISMSRVFGTKRAGMAALIRDTAEAMPGTRGQEWKDFLQQSLLDPLEGKVRAVERSNKLFGLLTKAEFLSKIALNARLPFAQIVQPLIALPGAVSLRGTLWAFGKALTSRITGGVDWELAKVSGALSDKGLSFLADFRFEATRDSIIARARQALGNAASWSFRAGDNAARTVAAIAGHAQAEDLVRYLRNEYSGTQRAWKAVFNRTPALNNESSRRWATKWLQKWGGLEEDEIARIAARVGEDGKWAGFTAEESHKIMTWFSDKTNFTGGVLDLPYWTRRTPLAKFATMFASFGYQQTRLTIENLLDSARLKSPLQALSVLGGALGAGEIMRYVDRNVFAKPQQEDMYVSRLLNDVLVSSVLGVMGNATNTAKFGFMPPVVGDMLHVGSSFVAGVEGIQAGDSFGSVVSDVARAHFPLMRQLSGIQAAGGLIYDKLSGNPTVAGDRSAYQQYVGQLYHTRGLAAKEGFDALLADMDARVPGTSQLMGAYDENNQKRLFEYLDNKLKEKGGDVTKLTESLAQSIYKSSPIYKMLTLDAETLVDLYKRKPGLYSQQGRATRYYVNFAEWVRSGTHQWAVARAEQFGWNPATITQADGPLKIHTGPISRSDFEQSVFYDTLPKEWRALDGARPDSLVLRMTEQRFNGVLDKQLLDENESLDAFTKYIPKKALDKAFRLPRIKAYKEKFPTKARVSG